MQLDFFNTLDVDSTNPFQDRVVCLLGTLHPSNKTVVQRVCALGGDCKPSTKVSRNVHFVIIGDNPPEDQMQRLEMLHYHGYYPRLLRQTDVDAILAGQSSGYDVPQVIGKSLHLTLQHYLSARPVLRPEENILYTRELYVSPETRMPSSALYQLLGNRGIYANPYIDDTTDYLVVSAQTIKHLEEGISDDTIRYIEQQYNINRSPSYRYVIISEDELMSWLKVNSYLES